MKRSPFRFKPQAIAVPRRGSSARTVATFVLLLVDKILYWAVLAAAVRWLLQ